MDEIMGWAGFTVHYNILYPIDKQSGLIAWLLSTECRHLFLIEVIAQLIPGTVEK